MTSSIHPINRTQRPTRTLGELRLANLRNLRQPPSRSLGACGLETGECGGLFAVVGRGGGAACVAGGASGVLAAAVEVDGADGGGEERGEGGEEVDDVREDWAEGGEAGADYGCAEVDVGPEDAF